MERAQGSDSFRNPRLVAWALIPRSRTDLAELGRTPFILSPNAKIGSGIDIIVQLETLSAHLQKAVSMYRHVRVRLWLGCGVWEGNGMCVGCRSGQVCCPWPGRSTHNAADSVRST